MVIIILSDYFCLTDVLKVYCFGQNWAIIGESRVGLMIIVRDYLSPLYFSSSDNFSQDILSLIRMLEILSEVKDSSEEIVSL